jgi:hypothetical protein
MGYKYPLEYWAGAFAEKLVIRLRLQVQYKRLLHIPSEPRGIL